MIEVFNSGGGTQSTAIAGLIIQGKLPRPDFVIIADTGRERGTTWQYLDQVVRPALNKVGIEVHRPTKEKYAYHHQELRNKNGNTLLIPAFTNQVVGRVGKLPGYCSNWWKVDVVYNFLKREFGINKSQVRKWIGFSQDEARRALRMMQSDDFKSGRVFFPLIDGVPMKRQHAIDFVTKEMGWPMPPRSACYMCPNMLDEEWATLTPEEHELACQDDELIRKHDPNAFLHSSCRPLREVNFHAQSELPGLDDHACSSGVCFV